MKQDTRSLVRNAAAAVLRWILGILIALPWEIISFCMRLLYGFRPIGIERVPRDKPYILLSTEFSPIALIVGGWRRSSFSKSAYWPTPAR